MTVAAIPSATLYGIDGRAITVEVHIGNGLPCFNIVGLPDAACRESRDRVRAALTSSGFTWPMRRLTINLAPSSIRKGGAGLDLAIAIGVLVAAGQVPEGCVGDAAFVGELGLDGTIRPVAGILSLVDAIRPRTVVVASASTAEASLLTRVTVRGASTLAGLVAALTGRTAWPAIVRPVRRAPDRGPDLADVRGQQMARWAVEVAAAGGHHLLMVGPPGGGKTMLARRLPGLLPALRPEEALESTRIHSAAGLVVDGLLERPPFRAPHHTASMVSIVGGGSATMRPGEISLAANGVLFLDELGEMPAAVLDTLRQPLEEGVIRLARARSTVTFPARMLLVAAMNPCPCGEGAPPDSCRCTEAARLRYARRLSGPLFDRFDLRVRVHRPEPVEFLRGHPPERTADVAPRVALVRALARARGAKANADLAPATLDRVAVLGPDAQALLERRLRTGGLSGRGAHRVRRVARTLADLEVAGALAGSSTEEALRAAGHALERRHIAGALELRMAFELAGVGA